MAIGGAAERGVRDEPGAGTGGGGILVVADDAALRAMLADALELEGYRVVGARTGAAALDLIARHPPALVLLDMRMPVLDGRGVAAALHERGIAVPLVVMTAGAEAERCAREIGADGYLAKPFALDDLLAAVARFCPRA